MADDINLLPTDSPARDEKEEGARTTSNEDMTLHVPSSEPEEKKPASPLGSTFLANLIEREKAEIEPPSSLFSQKIEPIPSVPAPKPAPQPVEIAPLRTPAPPPFKVAAPLQPPPTPPPPRKPPQPPKFAPEERGSGTLRVSLITANGGTGLSDLALHRRLRTFALIGFCGFALNGIVFGGLTAAKSSVEKKNTAAEKAVQDVDAQTAEREKNLGPVRDFQALSKAAARVLDNHSHWTQVLALLEERALPEVQFGSLAGAETGTLSFEVIARDYTTLAKQIVSFRQDPRVLKATIGTATADVGENELLKGVRSGMTLTIDPTVFRYKADGAPVAGAAMPVASGEEYGAACLSAAGSCRPPSLEACSGGAFTVATTAAEKARLTAVRTTGSDCIVRYEIVASQEVPGGIGQTMECRVPKELRAVDGVLAFVRQEVAKGDSGACAGALVSILKR